MRRRSSARASYACARRAFMNLNASWPRRLIVVPHARAWTMAASRVMSSCAGTAPAQTARCRSASPFNEGEQCTSASGDRAGMPQRWSARRSPLPRWSASQSPTTCTTMSMARRRRRGEHAAQPGGPNGTTQLYVAPSNGDGKSGCNLTGGTTLTSTSRRATRPWQPSARLATFTVQSCGDTQDAHRDAGQRRHGDDQRQPDADNTRRLRSTSPRQRSRSPSAPPPNTRADRDRQPA